MSARLDREFADEWENLGPRERDGVLRYMRSRNRDGVPGSTLLKYVGCISRQDLDRMAEVIERDF